MSGLKRVSVLLAALVAIAMLAVPAAEGQDVPPSSAPDRDVPALLSAPTAARAAGGGEQSRAVEVDLALLVPDAAVTVGIDVFDDARFTADLEPFDGGIPGWDAWTGPVHDIDQGTATFIRRGDVVSGVINTPGGTFRVQPRGDGSVARVAPEALRTRQTAPDHLIPPERDGAPSSSDPGPGVDAAPEADRGSSADVSDRVVDVLVAYTPAARVEMGSKAAIEAEAAMSVAVTNTAYGDSGVNASVRLVGVMETTSNVIIGDVGLDALTDPTDGRIDEVPRKRDALGADLVSLLTATDSSYCGLGWFLDTLSGDAFAGYTQVAWDCAVDDLAFAHELGHNMGLDHDRYASPGPPAFLDYGYGYVNVAAGWRTIMAYDTACFAVGTSCTRLARFSNPDQLYGGRALGRPAGGSNAADARQALNLTVPVVAGYRTANDTPKLGFKPIIPCRIVDTRVGGGSFRNGDTRNYQVAGGGAAFAGQGGNPGGCDIPADARAVEATVTAVDPAAGGFARAYPAGTPTPGATFLNYVPGQSIGNTGTIPIATSAATADLSLKNYGGATHYVVDIQGYFSNPAPLGYASITPCRIADTRARGGSLGSGATRTFQVAGSGATFAGQGGKGGGCSIPADAQAVEATITAVDPGAGGFTRAYPAGTPTPAATFLNFVRRQSTGNTGTIPIATSASTADLSLKSFGGSTHYVIDIQGYFSPGAPLGYISVKPCRVVDTRYVGLLTPGDVSSYQVAGSGFGFWKQGGTGDGCAVPTSAKAVEATITAVDPFSAGFARAYPAGTATPAATFLNYVDHQSIGNTGTIPIATTASVADLAIKNYRGYVDYVVDIQGFYAPR